MDSNINGPSSVSPSTSLESLSGAPSTGSESFAVPVKVVPAAGSLDSPDAAAASASSPSAVLDTPFNGALQPVGPQGESRGGALGEVSLNMPEEPALPPKTLMSRRRLLGLGLLAFGVLAAALLGARVELNKNRVQNASLASPSSRLLQQQVPLASLNKQLAAASVAPTDSSVTVNGSLVLAPSVQPSDPLPGQLYFNQAVNQMQYFDGTGFVKLQGESVTNEYSSTIRNSYGGTTVNNTYDTLITNSGASITGTPGTLAMFGSRGATLADSLITQNGTTVDVADTGTNTVSVGSDAGASITNVQGGTGGLSIATGAASGASGDVSIASGASSTTAAGNVTIDTGAGFVSGTVVSDLDFEDGIDGMEGWTGGATSVQDCTVAYTGSCSLAVAGSNFWGILQDSDTFVPITAGHHYFISAWVRAATSPTLVGGALMWNTGAFDSSYLAFDNVTTTTSGWTEMIASGTAPAGATYGAFRFGGGDGTSNGTQYFDDITVTDLSSSSSASELNLGATNAQFVTLGNMNELGPTTIDGGSGINLNAGSAGINVAGGAVNIDGTGASSFETDNGALNLGAGGGTGGGVIVSTQSPSTTAFQVQGYGVDLLTVDSTDNEVSLGTGAGASFGYSGIGPDDYSGAGGPDAISASKFTTTNGGAITSMSAYITSSRAAPYNSFQFAVYADNSGSPGSYIASSAVGTLSATSGWNTLPITATLSPSTTYWLVYWQNDDINDSSNGDASYTGINGALSVQNAYTWQTGSDNGMPATFPGGSTLQSGDLRAIYASYAASGPALTLSSAGTLTQSGAALFQDPTDSTTALQVEDSLGDVLLTADTADMQITIGGNLIVSGNVTVGGHIITGGGTPTIAAGAAAACGGTASVAITGNDTSGTVTVTTGSGSCGSGGDLATIGFSSDFGAVPQVTLTPDNADSQVLGAYVDGSTLSAGSFTIGTANTPALSTAYTWSYLTVQ